MIKFKIRKMREDDIEIVYKNIHSDFVKKYFKNKEKQEEIHKNHDEWYRSHLSSKEYFIYLIENNSNDFIGITSYQIFEKKATISIYINKDFRGKNYSKNILKQSILEFLSYSKTIKEIQANILEENIISKKIFSDLGFKFKNKTEICSDGLEYQVYIKYFN